MVGNLRHVRCVHGMIKLAHVMEQQNLFHQFKYAFSAGPAVQYRYTLKYETGLILLRKSHRHSILLSHTNLKTIIFSHVV